MSRYTYFYISLWKCHISTKNFCSTTEAWKKSTMNSWCLGWWTCRPPNTRSPNMVDPNSSQSGTLLTCYHTIHVNVMECLVHNGIHPVSDPGVSFMSIMICYSSIYLLFLIRKHLYCRFYQHKCFSTGDGWWKKSWETVESTTLKGGTWRGLLQMFFLFKRVMFRFHITLW